MARAKTKAAPKAAAKRKPRNATGETGRASSPADIERLMLRGLGSTRSGARVNPDTAMRVAAVYACVRVLADSIAMLPLRLYRENGDLSEIAKGEYLDRLVSKRPNPLHTPFDFKRFMVACLALRGNAYARKFAIGTPAQALVALHPTRVRVAIDDAGNLRYFYATKPGIEAEIPAREMVHLRALSTDGLMGMSVIQAAAEAIGISLRTEEHGARLFSNGAQTGHVLTHPGRLGKEAQERMAAQLAERHSGAENAHKTLLLEEGMSIEKIGMTSEESQFLESRKFQRSEIAMFFGIPPHMIGDVERGTSWGSGIEQQSLGFVTYTLLPWLTNIAQGLERDLIPLAKQDGYSFRFLVDDLIKADFFTRQQGRKIQYEAGIISQDEWRKSEGMNPRANGGGFIGDREGMRNAA